MAKIGTSYKKPLETHLGPNLAQLGAKSVQLGPKLGPKIRPTNPKVDPSWDQDGLLMAPEPFKQRRQDASQKKTPKKEGQVNFSNKAVGNYKKII